MALSDVAIVLSRSSVMALNRSMARMKKRNTVEFIRSVPVVHTDSSGSLLHVYRNVHWYAEEGSGFWEDFLNRQPPETYYFLRIGESLGDWEEQGDMLDPFNVRAEIKLRFNRPV